MSWYYKEKKINVYRPVLDKYEIDLLIESLRTNKEIKWTDKDKKLYNKLKFGKVKLTDEV